MKAAQMDETDAFPRLTNNNVHVSDLNPMLLLGSLALRLQSKIVMIVSHLGRFLFSFHGCSVLLTTSKYQCTSFPTGNKNQD
jgi:hypothetical protein